jgi:hypothetical protein
MTLDSMFPAFLHWQGPRELRVHDRGAEVACLLMERLRQLGEARSARVVVVAHPQEPQSATADVHMKDRVLACARDSGLRILDLFPVFDALSSEQRSRLFDRHLTVEGYRLIATEVAAALAGNTDSRRR